MHVFYYLISTFLIVNARVINTNYTSIEAIVQKLINPHHIKKITVENEYLNAEFVPPLDFNKNITKLPQQIKYQKRPQLLSSSIALPKMSFEETWTQPESNMLRNNLKSNLLDANIEFIFKIKKGYVNIHLLGYWNRKSFVVPGFVLEDILNQMRNKIANMAE
jgi:hypothetical protein